MVVILITAWRLAFYEINYLLTSHISSLPSEKWIHSNFVRLKPSYIPNNKVEIKTKNKNVDEFCDK